MFTLPALYSKETNGYLAAVDWKFLDAYVL